MGRLFQYNRFGAASTASNKKDINARHTKSNTKKQQEQQSVITTTSKAMGATSAAANNNSQCQLYAELYADYATSEAATTNAKNMEFFAYRKYQQWGHKLLHGIPNNHNKQMQSELPSNAGGQACCHDDADNDSDSDTVQLLNVANDSTTKRPRVYDCMKDFLRRKFFQQQQQTTTNANATTQTKVAHEKLIVSASAATQVPDEDDVTSDYEELDVLDSSYNADEEDATDCSCSYNSDTVAPTTARQRLQPTKTTTKKSLLSLNCWHTAANSSSSGASTTDSSSSDYEEDAAPQAPHADDSDAGISDCCQLLPPTQNEQSPHKHQHRSPKRSQRKTKHRKTQHRHAAKTNATIEQDLLDAVWYQPCWSAKTAQAYLQAESPGTFIVRRKARSLELCLRTPSKVKSFAIVGADGSHFKLKGARKQFSTLKALVTHHSVMAEQLPLTLLLPREQETPQLRMSVRCADDFVGIESLEILDILKTLQAKQQPEVSLIVW